MKRNYFLLSLTICLVAICSVVHSATLEVGTGKPYSTIEYAIDNSNGGDTVLVYDGTYNEVIDFKGQAITLKSANGAANTIIDGIGLNDSVVKFVNGETSTSVLDGFTITQGSGHGFSYPCGGGIYCSGSSPTITNCTISDNKHLLQGAGIYCIDNSFLTITNCSISDNFADNLGGGIYADNSTLTITNCTISNNGALTNGGGIFSNGPSTITNCTISNNFGRRGAGGINSSNSTITNCTILGNSSGVGGVAGIGCSNSTITNCIISGNRTAGGGVGGIGCSNSTITNCTISSNVAGSMGNGVGGISSSNSTITNCILWANTAWDNTGSPPNPQISEKLSVVTYSDIDQNGFGNPDGSADANGNIRLNPLFVRNPNPGANGFWGSGDDDDYGDLHLQSTSPCIDAGTSAGAPAYDIEGTIRPQGSGYDMGAYEFKEINVAVDIKPGSCPNPIGNGDNNGVVPFAIMGTVENFDVTQIDPASIRITREGVAGEVRPIRWIYGDVATPFEGELCECQELTGDGYMDLSMKAYRADLVNILKLKEVAGQTVVLTVTGKLKDEFGGTPIRGQDCMRVLKTVLLVK